MTESGTCDVNLAAYLADPKSEEWREFRTHFPVCERCSAALAEWTALETALEMKPSTAHPEPDKLVALLDAPESLSDSERAELRRHVEACRTCADEVAALGRFDLEALAREPGGGRAAEPPVPTAAARRAPRSTPPRRPRWLAAWVSAAAAAGMLVGAMLPGLMPSDAEMEGALRIAEARLEESERVVSHLRNEIATLSGELVASRERAANRQEELAATRQAIEEREKRIARLAAELEERSGTEIAGNVAAPAEAEAAQVRPETPAAAGGRTAGPATTGSSAAPIRIASVPDFVSPNPYGAPMRVTSRTRAVAEARTPEIQALAPETAGHTYRAQPTLYWHLSEATDLPAELLLLRGEQEELVYEGRLEAPDGPGIQKIELAELGVELAAGETYTWGVSLVVDPENRARDLFFMAGIRRVDPPEGLSPRSRDVQALARAGNWYETLDLLSRAIGSRADEDRLVAYRDALLAQVGIDLHR